MRARKMTCADISPSRGRQSGDAEPVGDDSAAMGKSGAMGRANSKLSTCVETVVDDQGNHRQACLELIPGKCLAPQFGGATWQPQNQITCRHWRSTSCGPHWWKP